MPPKKLREKDQDLSGKEIEMHIIELHKYQAPPKYIITQVTEAEFKSNLSNPSGSNNTPVPKIIEEPAMDISVNKYVGDIEIDSEDKYYIKWGIKLGEWPDCITKQEKWWILAQITPECRCHFIL